MSFTEASAPLKILKCVKPVEKMVQLREMYLSEFESIFNVCYVLVEFIGAVLKMRRSYGSFGSGRGLLSQGL